MTKGSCGKEPDECESLMSGSESGVGIGRFLPTVTERSLSLTPFRVNDIVTVGVQQDEVSRVIVGVVAVPMMHFQHVLCRETQSTLRATSTPAPVSASPSA